MMLSLGANPASFRSIVGDGLAPQRGTLPTTLVRALRGAKSGSFAKRFTAVLDFCHNLASDFPQYIGGKEFEKMKTFIVYDLDSQMPVAVGEQVSAETARYCASVATGIFQANLLAEEIDLEKQVTY
jgi:hypothetical protein